MLGDPRDRQIADLSEIEFKVFSPWGEDGIIEWLVSHVDVPNRRFVEFGVETFQEANCRFLMLNRNWRGFVMDGSEANIAGLRADPLFWKYDLSALSTFVSAENINGLLEKAGLSGPLGLLSIDIDGNDYWVWKAISIVSPAIVVCEFNAVLGNAEPIAVPYKASFRRLDGHFSGLYFGCSIGALQHLANEKGYQFVGTNSHGVNAFFVRNDLAAPVLGLLRERRAFPSRTRESRDASGRLSYVRGYARLELIQHLPVVDVVTGKRARSATSPSLIPTIGYWKFRELGMPTWHREYPNPNPPPETSPPHPTPRSDPDPYARRRGSRRCV